ncbi:MAG: 30S ribosomal protein S20 [Ignavibacteriales bacterium]|nr:MAG: 30S ribosomal protein S20 [Ignavibacteriales bacterium]
MAHHKSAKKRIRSTKRKTEYNKAATSKIKTLTKKVLASDNVKEIEPVYKEAVATLDRNVTKGRLHKNTAARKKAALTKHVNKLSKKTETAVKA